MTWPTVTVSPSATRISVIVPLAGAGSSMSTLSVEISTSVSPSATVSPTFTDHSRMVPSVTDSPPVGRDDVERLADAGWSATSRPAAPRRLLLRRRPFLLRRLVGRGSCSAGCCSPCGCWSAPGCCSAGCGSAPAGAVRRRCR